MSTSNQTYKELAIPYFKEVFELIDEVMIAHNIPYYLIGASAMALALLEKGIKPGRGTKDIDFAIMISGIQQYDELIGSLEERGFLQLKDIPHRVYNSTFNAAIDILPFGEIEEHFTVNFSDRKTELHVLGFTEVLEDYREVIIEEKIARIPPLAGIVVLKLVAWSDRPEQRENDLMDILKIIEHFFDIEYDEIVEFHHDTFPEGDFDNFIIGAEVLGRKVNSILARSKHLSDRIHGVLADNLNKESESLIAREWARRKNWGIEYAYSLLKAFQKGLLYNQTTT
jgi:predicted nucleotidyltransferase